MATGGERHAERVRGIGERAQSDVAELPPVVRLELVNGRHDSSLAS
jgi:hypothetical protein